MIRERTKPPRTQRSFATPWGELDYLCKKIRFWLYARRQKPNAERYSARLHHVLRNLPENDMAIIREEGWALLCELQEKIGDAIIHRRREIHLMERLLEHARTGGYSESTRAYMLADRDSTALRERRSVLAALECAKVEPGSGAMRKAQ